MNRIEMSHFVVNLVKTEIRNEIYIVDVYYQCEANDHPFRYFYVNGARDWYESWGDFEDDVWTTACMKDSFWDDFDNKYRAEDSFSPDFSKIPSVLKMVKINIAPDFSVQKEYSEIGKWDALRK